jgi:ankyrin repeat protein
MNDHQWLVARLDDSVNEGDLESVRYLLEQGADVNGRNVLGDTPLMAAAHVGSARMVRLLLASGADAGARNGRGETAEDIAGALGHREVLSSLADQGAV